MPAWSKGFVATTLEVMDLLTSDVFGNIVVSGQFTGQVDLGTGPLNQPNTTNYLAKYATSGKAQWVEPLAGGGSTTALAVDAQGGIFLGGNFSVGSTNVGCGPIAGTGSGLTGFIAKLDSSGNCLWSKSLGGTIFGRAAIATSTSGRVAIAGMLQGSWSYGGGTITGGTGTSPVLVAVVLDGSGNHVWSKGFGTPHSVSGTSASAGVGFDPMGNVLLSGTGGSLNFGGGTIGGALFAAKLDGAGNHVWSVPVSGTASVSNQGVLSDAAGNVTIGGNYWVGTMDFGGGPLPTPTGNANGVYVAKLNSADGTYRWAHGYGGPGDDVSMLNMAADGMGNLVFGGILSGGQVSFGGPAPSGTMFLTKLSSFGGYLWSRGYGGPGSRESPFVTLLPCAAPVVAGWYTTSFDLGTGPLPTPTTYGSGFLALLPP